MFGTTLQSKVLDSLRRVQMPDGTDEVLASIREAKDSGQDYLRTLAGNVRDQSYRATRTVGDMVKERPAESLVLVAGAAFAVGWLVRHMRDRVAAARAPRTTSSRARTRKS
jgi:hypothetical protein